MIKHEDYKFSFDEKACKSCGGKCCTGEHGAIWVSKDECEAFANALNLPLSEFEARFTHRIYGRTSLREKPYIDGYACVFFDETTKGCRFYEIRPQQCRTFPFWECYKSDFRELKQECKGVKSEF